MGEAILNQTSRQVANIYPNNGRYWTKSNVTEGKFNFLCDNNGLIVAGSGSDAGLWYSENGKTWAQSNITSGNFKVVACEENRWIAGGSSDNGIYYSYDGKTWRQTNITSGSFNFKCYGRGLWNIGGYEGLCCSSNGIMWAMHSDLTYFSAIHYGNEYWVARSNNNTGLYHAPNGQEFRQSNITSGNFADVEYANGIWLTSNTSPYNVDTGIYYSVDGITWQKSNISSGYKHSFNYANGLWTSCSYPKGVYYSSDGKTWTATDVYNTGDRKIYFANNIWTVGTGFRSTDGKTWENSFCDSSTSMECFDYSNGIFVAGTDFDNGRGGPGIYYSTDAKVWSKTNVLSKRMNVLIGRENGVRVASSGYDSVGIYYSTPTMEDM